MKKILKRIFSVLALLTLASVGYFAAHLYSEKLAVDVAYLECKLHSAGFSTEQPDPKAFDAAYRNYGLISEARLTRDWIRDRILLNWIAEPKVSEDGLQDTISLKIDVREYSGYSYEQGVFRTFDRETLKYRWEVRETSSSPYTRWMERTCVKIPKEVFELRRQNSANATLRSQKI